MQQITEMPSQIHQYSLLQTSLTKKKYCKVNENIKNSFLNLIIHQNMSIKQASASLNINYSSAKAILSQHRKTIKKTILKKQKKGIISIYKQISSNDVFKRNVMVLCSTGGRSFFNDKIIQKHNSIRRQPIILLGGHNLTQFLENTSQSLTN